MEGLDSAGTYKEAALPNIKGSIAPNPKEKESLFQPENDPLIIEGALDIEYNKSLATGSTTQPGSVYSSAKIIFNASKYNDIYKDSCVTVQPSAYTVRYYIRAK